MTENSKFYFDQQKKLAAYREAMTRPNPHRSYAFIELARLSSEMSLGEIKEAIALAEQRAVELGYVEDDDACSIDIEAIEEFSTSSGCDQTYLKIELSRKETDEECEKRVGREQARYDNYRNVRKEIFDELRQEFEE